MSNEEIKKDLDSEFDNLKSMHQQVSSNIDDYLVKNESDLPNFGELELYDYETDVEKFKSTSKNMIKDMVDLYLGDAPDLISHPYIKSKMEEDTTYYASTQLLQKMSEKLLLQQLRQIDNGENSPRMYEVTNGTMQQIRENIIDGRKARTEIEKLYKEIRKDFGLNEMGSTKKTPEADDEGIIVDTKKLNEKIQSKIDEYIKNKPNS